MMSDIAKKLRASVRMDAINGDGFERSVCGRQMKEAADEIDRLRQQRDRAVKEFREIEAILGDYPYTLNAQDTENLRDKIKNTILELEQE